MKATRPKYKFIADFLARTGEEAQQGDKEALFFLASGSARTWFDLIDLHQLRALRGMDWPQHAQRLLDSGEPLSEAEETFLKSCISYVSES